MEGTSDNREMLLQYLEAAAEGDVEEVRRRLDCEPGLVNAQHPESGDTALIVAARENHPEVIAILLEYGADVTLYNTSRQTALHVANAEIRPLLLAGSGRGSFPQLSMAQAAWQGDLDTVLDLLPTEQWRDVNAVNAQGLSALMLAVRDVDMFEALTMKTDYRPVAVLEELLKHKGDAGLLDRDGNSAMSYVIQVRSATRQQLIDVLHKSPPPTETLDQECRDFCPNTKPAVADVPPPSLLSPDGHNASSGNRLRCDDGVFSEDTSKMLNPGREWDGAGASLRDLEMDDAMEKRNKNVRSGQQIYVSSPEDTTLRTSISRQLSLPPLEMRKDEKDSRLRRLGLGYLLQGSNSEPSISEAQTRMDPLQNITHIKDHIRQRLSSTEPSRRNRTFPPISYSPRSPKSFRLRPLIMSRNNIGKQTTNSDASDKSRVDGTACGEDSPRKSIETSEDVVLSKDLVQISLISLESTDERTDNLMGDLSSRCAQLSIGLGSGRRKKQGNSNCESVRLPHICCNEIPEQQVNKTLGGNREETESEPLPVQESQEATVKNTTNHNEENALSINGAKEPQELETNLSHSRKTLTTTEDNFQSPQSDHKLEHVTKLIESIKINSPRTPRLSYLPFVHITFSDSNQELHCPPPKPFLAKRKPNTSISMHNASHSFNIIAQKEKRSKKNKVLRINSAPVPTTKYSKPLSISNGKCIKCVPLPALVCSSAPSPSKASRKASISKPNSAERSSSRSQTQLSLYTKKRLNSPINPTMPPRAKTAQDFQDIHYSDMFVEIKPQDSGPGIYQMFETPAYINSSSDITKGHKETGSASSRRSFSSKSIRSGSSRESSARAAKKTKSRSRKKLSATNRPRKNSATKLLDVEVISEKTEENVVIISGTNWEIKAPKQEGCISQRNKDCMVNGIMELDQQFSANLSIIKEATLENSVNTEESSHLSLIKQLQNLVEANIDHFKQERLHPAKTTENRTKDSAECSYPSKSNHRRKYFQIPEATGLTQNPQEVSEADRTSDKAQQSLEEAAWISLLSKQNYENHKKEILMGECETEHDTQHTHSIPTTIKDVLESDQLTDMLNSLTKNLIQLDEESNNCKTVIGHQDSPGNTSLDQGEEAEEPGLHSSLTQISQHTSLSDSNTDGSAHRENHSEFRTSDSSIHWVKGEVLGKGAYGTVYCGLTSQGELIAAKQVMLHGSDPAVAEKEYKKLQEEVDLLKALKHDNIVGYLGTCLQRNVVTIFMEFVPGGSIASILRHFGPLQEAVMSKYTTHILQGIAYLHKNRVVHRDIKGNNVMLMPNGVIKLIDFGCAKRLNGLNMNGTRGEMLKSMHGTPYWMAPEVISESGHGEKSDIWSIGCTVFEMATGKPPLAHMNKLAAMFYIAAQRGLMPTLPDHFSKRARDFVNSCLTREQEERPSAEQLLQHAFTRRRSPDHSEH
ncbi:mitogen-activated protein kinase kinase kinase 19 [Hyperolius riggenbachi]|uniref:mitogen-activated protein kinase kinase kinase 19 n=1 Tax=Hyperolius riggenbachi TaxID=752182 RepID=UPI0035A272E7